MSYDNSPLLVERNERGFWVRAQQLDQDKSNIGLSYVLACSAVPVSLTGTLVETVLQSITVPGGLLGRNGALRLSSFWTATNNANTKTVKASFGGQQFYAAATGTWASFGMLANLANRNSENSQVSTPINVTSVLGGLGQPLRTFAVDTAQPQNLEIRGILANVGDTLTLEHYVLEVFPG
jgi:hypothetical protein